jgi:hypothetical protein
VSDALKRQTTDIERTSRSGHQARSPSLFDVCSHRRLSSQSLNRTKRPNMFTILAIRSLDVENIVSYSPQLS